MTTVSQQRDISERTRSLSTLGRIDYSDVATIVATPDATPEEWARVVIEEVAGARAQRFWRMIGLRLDPPSTGHIGGWKIAGEGDDWIVLATRSWYASINAVCEMDAGHLSLALLARFDHPFARIACPPITLVHRRGIPILLRAAVRRLASKA